MCLLYISIYPYLYIPYISTYLYIYIYIKSLHWSKVFFMWSWSAFQGEHPLHFCLSATGGPRIPQLNVHNPRPLSLPETRRTHQRNWAVSWLLNPQARTRWLSQKSRLRIRRRAWLCHPDSLNMEQCACIRWHRLSRLSSWISFIKWQSAV